MSNNAETETIYEIPFVEHEYTLYKESRKRNRIMAALIITNAIWLCLTALIVVKGYEKARKHYS
jgi:hypothetical protein